MYKVICITNRKLCGENFLGQLEAVAAQRPDMVILREKDMDESEFTILAEKVNDICKKYDVALAINSFIESAKTLGIRRLHLPLHKLREMSAEERACFDVIGASCHSADEAKEAQSLGAGYIIAGHIFETDCKKGLEGRGLAFLEEVCKSVDIPVYAIGGIGPDNVKDVINTGADGICIMSGFMKTDDPEKYMKKIRGEQNESQES